MTKRIFRSIFFTSLAVVLIGLTAAVGCLYYYFENIREEQLESELMLAAAGVEESGVSYIEKLSTDGIRLTLVSREGKVLADTDTDPEELENHADREEIAEALSSGKGESSRYSSTLTEKTIYRAVLLSSGDVLRVSVSAKTVLSLVAGILPWFVSAVILAAALSWLLSKHLANRIIAPLNRVDLNHPLENDTYEELAPMLVKISRQHEEIASRLRELGEKTDEFNCITENMNEALVLLDAVGKVISINRAAKVLFGANENSVGSDFLTVERSHKVSCAIDKARADGRSSFKEERNGRIYQFGITRIESGGRTAGLVILAVDVSEKERAEETRREFSANVSHELKTPLTSIIASADLLENGLVKPEDTPRFIGHIKNESSRLLNLIEDIIRLSELDEGDGRTLTKESVDLSGVAKEAVDQLRAAAIERGVNIELNAQPCTLLSNSRLVYEIAFNLIENAVKYNVPNGSVTVSVKSLGGAAEAADGCAVLRVSDTGIGIPPEHRERIFERFWRVDKSHSRASGGTGLGLSIVKHAAALLGASISLDSEEGKGTDVTVTFKPQ